MTRMMVLGLTLLLAACGQNSMNSRVLASNTVSQQEDAAMETDQHVLSPAQEDEYFSTYFPGANKASAFRFPQTTWRECDDVVTGNYYQANCSNSRGISVILKKFMDEHMYKCVNAGLAAQGGGSVNDFHIVHAGIFADPRHSPRSLHSENRAIDIKSMEIQLTSGAVKNFVYQGTSARPFYTAFRSCWGKIVHDFNGCPYYRSTPGLTGTIGWENANHQHHMHTSVPYCVGGNYGTYYYQK